MEPDPKDLVDRAAGAILGVFIGDALGVAGLNYGLGCRLRKGGMNRCSSLVYGFRTDLPMLSLLHFLTSATKPQ